MVTKETNSKYQFDAGKARLSLWSKSLVLEKSRLFSIDTTKTSAYYDVKIAKLKFSLASWGDLIFKKKVVVDSLEIIGPLIRVQASGHQVSKSKGAFRPSDILTFLEKTQKYFNLRNLSVKGASFSYKQNAQQPIRINDINLVIRNFVKVNNDDRHLFGSDQISLSVGKQHLELPHHKLTVNFKSLKFNSNNQYFNVDSLTVYQQNENHTGRMKFATDRFTFNSKHLPATYQKNQLLLDTVTCVNPRLTLYKNNQKTVPNSQQTVRNKDALFKLINIKLIHVVNASLMQNGQNEKKENSIGKSANLDVYNFSVLSDKSAKITLDSINMNLKDLTFLSKDSLHKLTIARFSLSQNKVVFHDIQYSPTSLLKTHKSLVFSAPAMTLKNIDLEALLNKKIHADQAVLSGPIITLSDKNRNPEKGLKTVSALKENKKPVFYETLHQFKQMINVERLLIRQGNIHYSSFRKVPLQLDIRDLNAEILLNKAFMSDSLVDIKHAIPDLRIGKVNLKSKGLLLSLYDYKFNGGVRENWARRVDLNLHKAKFTAEHLYWEVFDWDVYSKTRAIQIDSLHVKKIIANLSTDNASKRPDRRKSLPVVRLGKLGIDEMLFNSRSGKTQLSFAVNDFYADHIKSIEHYFIWSNIHTKLTNFTLKSPNSILAIHDISFNNDKGGIRGASFVADSEKSYTRILLPSLFFKASLRSTNINQLVLNSISANGANIDVHANSGIVRQPAHLPEINKSFQIGYVNITNAILNYTREEQNDTLKFTSTLNLIAKNVHNQKKAGYLLGYDQMDLNVIDGKFAHQNTQVLVPYSWLRLRSGLVEKNNQKITLSTAVDFRWYDLLFHLSKDSAQLTSGGLSGAFKDRDFRYTINEKVDFKSILFKTRFEGDHITYSNKKIQANASDYTWNPVKNKLDIGRFGLQPALSQELFFKTSRYQEDYISIKGDSVSLAGVKPNSVATDSLFSVDKINLYNINLDFSRDKHLPSKPGHIKPMPTRLLSMVKKPFQIDEIALHRSAVIYKELAAKSNQWSEIPFTDIHGRIFNVSNRKDGDSLALVLSARLFSSQIRHFSYKESYADSLSGFTAKVNFSQMDLRAFSRMSMPMASVGIKSGQADTLYSYWSGNKYAALGRMNFNFEGLKIKFFGNNSHKWQFVPAVKTLVVNLILPGSNRRPSVIYVERNQQKFIFNYWIKAQLSGLLSTFGLKKSKKYRKQYELKSEEYKLPDHNSIMK
ncbi:hypothetical protein [Pedobacter sp.]|uniref:hypothetical protein n=1 Tax=Pedobacter sp. TaxID=1411316 RepID=UPI003BABA8D1